MKEIQIGPVSYTHLDVEDLAGSKEKGWYLVCVDGYPLGFGKLAGGVLKNKYLPGWRLC